MLSDSELETRHPEVAWRVPIMVSHTAGRLFYCRFCIYREQHGKTGLLVCHRSSKLFREHMRSEHKVSPYE